MEWKFTYLDSRYTMADCMGVYSENGGVAIAWNEQAKSGKASWKDN